MTRYEMSTFDSTPPVSFTYDEAGRLTSAITDGATNTFTYTGSRLIAETQNGAVLARFTDAAGRPSGIALNGFETRYGYDNRGRLSSVTFTTPTNALMHSRTNELLYTYLAGTDLISGYTSGSLSVTRTYEPRRDLITAVSNRFNNATISAFDYEYDALNRRTRRTDHKSLSTDHCSFSYNARSEITDAVMYTNVYGYVYDPIGNRLFSSCNAATNTYTANHLNQYTAINTATPQYDADGNLTALGVWAYTYDAENRMTGASSNGIPVASYTYDYGSRLVREETATMTRRFIWDGWNIVASIEVDKAEQSTNTTHYVWGLDLSGTLQGAGGVGGLLATVRDDGVFYACSDANGNVTEYVDESGAIRAHYEYSPFGEIIAQSGDLADAFLFRFSTKYHVPETRQYYYGYRFYDPLLGRWLSRDPIEEEGGLNLYGFVGNDPVNRRDMLGLLDLAILPPAISYVNIKYGGDYDSNASLICVPDPLEGEGRKSIKCKLIASPRIRLSSDENIREAHKAASKVPGMSVETHERYHHRVFMATYVASFRTLTGPYESKRCCNYQARILEVLSFFETVYKRLRTWERAMEYGTQYGKLTPYLEYGRGEVPVAIPKPVEGCE